MVDKLNHIIQRLDAQQIPLADATCQGFTRGVLPNAQGFGESPQSRVHSFVKAREGDIEDFMEIPSFRTTADTILLWPIFEGRYPPEYLVDALFEAQVENLDDESDIPQDEAPQRLARMKLGRPNFREDEVDVLVEKFISYVHIKNPILDIKTLKMYA